MNRVISAAVIGAGWAATERHVPALVAHPAARLAGICDPVDPAAAARLASKSGSSVFATLDDVVGSDVELVSVCTPPATHAEICERILSAGKHVLVEKPMVLSADDGSRLAELAASKNVTLCPSHNLLFLPAVLNAAHLLRDAGEILTVTVFQWNKRGIRTAAWTNQMPHGHFIEDAPHGLYLLRHFVGNLRVKHARERTARVAPGAAIEWVRVDLDADGRAATLVVGSGAPTRMWAVVLVRENGVAVIDLDRDLVLRLPTDNTRRRGRRRSIDVVTQLGKWSLDRLRSRRRVNGHERLISRLLESIRDGSPPPVSAADAVATTELTQDALRSLD